MSANRYADPASTTPPRVAPQGGLIPTYQTEDDQEQGLSAAIERMEANAVARTQLQLAFTDTILSTTQLLVFVGVKGGYLRHSIHSAQRYGARRVQKPLDQNRRLSLSLLVQSDVLLYSHSAYL